MPDERPTTNVFCHVEIPVAEMDRAARFYTEVFGWKVQPIPEMNYAIFQVEGGIGGGLDPTSEPGSRGLINYIYADDLEGTLERIESAGGATERPVTEVEGAGWLAHFRDTEGNVLGLWKGRGEKS